MLSPEVNVSMIDLNTYLDNTKDSSEIPKQPSRSKKRPEIRFSEQTLEEVKYIDMDPNRMDKRIQSQAFDLKESTKGDTIGTSNSAL